MTSNQKLVIVSVILIIVGAILESKAGIGVLMNILGWLGLIVALVSFIRIKIKESKEPKSKKNKDKTES